ncbi:low molecular weight phosphatase family protein [Sinomonas sp. ASV322]|uniref:arsenate reductase/protein-tyrosine-phosphatase family protein n=1 Tax=Sinomonas sp. ASV322 TaxID=3041920 RepID=UPI0027DBDC15|nr:low molecular weight phosphatase family protein [Sinomonas sp. ASV322]MDQ4501644.1 low molecular weight phosphatase family protein [Sinomonas sp. ASV322]
MSVRTPFRILAVCTGNVCRSPLAERLLQSGLDEVAPGEFAVSSAGTRALVGDPAQPLSAEIADRLGSTLDGFRARQLTEALVTGADLVLILAETHRAAVLSASPAALRRTFTLREFARIVDLLPGPTSRETASEAWARLVANGNAERHRVRVSDPALNDVSDPYGLGPSAYERMADELVPAVSALITAAVPRKRGRRTVQAGSRAAVRAAERRGPTEIQPAERRPR